MLVPLSEMLAFEREVTVVAETTALTTSYTIIQTEGKRLLFMSRQLQYVVKIDPDRFVDGDVVHVYNNEIEVNKNLYFNLDRHGQLRFEMKIL